MSKSQSMTAEASLSAPQITDQSGSDPRVAAGTARNDLDALAWLLDGNSGPIPADILARLNGVSPTH